MGSVRRGGMKSRALILDFFLLLPAVALAAEPAVEVEVDAEKRSFTREELLARPDAATIEIPKEVTSGAPMTYGPPRRCSQASPFRRAASSRRSPSTASPRRSRST